MSDTGSEDANISASEEPSISASEESNVSEFENEDDLRCRIDASFDEITSAGSFACQSYFYDANPGLEIAGLGRFGVPLYERDVKAIIGHSHQAPFGKGHETIVDDTSVRRTWEINGDQIALRHSRWPEFERLILTDTSRRLGVPEGSAGVRAELYKLLVYEEGVRN